MKKKKKRRSQVKKESHIQRLDVPDHVVTWMKMAQGGAKSTDESIPQ